MKKIVIACDSYNGCLSSSEVARAAAEGVAEVYPDCKIVRLAVADGGEGTVDALVDTLGGHLEWAEVSDPLGRPVKAVYGVAGDLAIIESAAACGLTLLTKEERNPLITTTRGLGELILAAIDKGCRRVSGKGPRPVVYGSLRRGYSIYRKKWGKPCFRSAERGFGRGCRSTGGKTARICIENTS